MTTTYTPATSGIYSLEVYNYRNSAPTTCVYNYIDDIAMIPQNSDLTVYPQTMSAVAGGQIYLTLIPGAAHAGEDYIVLMSRGSHPGFPMNGFQIPLNRDDIFFFSLNNANGGIFQNTIGTIDASGYGSPRVNVPSNLDPSYVGQCYSVAFMLTATSGSPPVTYVSLPAIWEITP